MLPANTREKVTVIKRLHTERRRLEANLARLSDEEILQPNSVGKWSFKDVLAHLAHWEAFFPDWIAASRSGDNVEVPAPGLTFKKEDLDTLNQRIWQEHCDQSLEDVREYFRAIHAQFMALAESLTDEEVLTPHYYAFTGGALYDWLNAYAAHDLWGKTEIRQWMKAQRK
ncbi:MAG: hypothetical protein A2Y73_01150 [Chloroflexi bacterium RBG_13_56_8]|nr:MAG: hypothetical protein A2Y73_01150 [Chloroflexi bacterium RBG_13_56_8]